MKTRNRLTTLIAATIAVGLLAAILAFRGARQAVAFHETENRVLHSGMFGIAPLQTAQINLVNIGNPHVTAARACNAEIKFYDGQGNVLGQSRVSLMPGQSDSLGLSHRELGRRGRVQIRAELVGFNPQPDPPGCLATLEVVDDPTGRTALFIGNPHVVPNPR